MKLRAERFAEFSGGLNLLRAPHLLQPGESPDLCNVTWDQGSLRCRRGQSALGQLPPGAAACAPRLFHGWLIAHIGRSIWAFKLRRETETDVPVGLRDEAAYDESLSETPGVFLPWRDTLIYKTRGAFLILRYDPEFDRVRGEFVTDSPAETGAYVPVIQLNTDPETGAGDLFQPENRLCGDKIVRFTAKPGVTDYQLPARELDLVRSVLVDGEAVTDYTVDLPAGIVRFSAEPSVVDPDSANQVEIRYRKANPQAFQSLMNCAAGTLFSVGQGHCLVLGGGEDQPNAWFWSGSGSAGMDPTYFPVNQYNLAGSMSDPITAFGTQQNRLIVFQRRSLGQAESVLTELGGRTQIAMRYARISDSVGCDLPGSVQSVENHLVWCSRQHGICRLENRSAAGESAICVLSGKIHRNRQDRGLLSALRGVSDGEVRSVEIGRKYLLLAGDAAWEWNHALSGAEDPVWFFHRGIQGVGFAVADETLYELLPSGVVAVFRRTCADFGGPIEKYYTLPIRSLGGETRQKTVKSVYFTLRPVGYGDTEITYFCDFSRRRDPTNLRHASWALSPRNLSQRDLRCTQEPRIFRRHPGFHNLRHLSIRLYNNGVGEDLTLAAATILYTTRGAIR